MMTAQTELLAGQAALRKLITNEIVASLQIAKVKLTVNDAAFQDVLNPSNGRSNTVADMDWEDEGKKHNRVRIEKPVGADNTALFVKPGGATIRFKIVSAGGQDTYYPLGIAFVRKNEDQANEQDPNRLGRLNFEQSQIRPEDDCIFVTDGFKDDGEPDEYKFSIIIQRKSDGAIGIIDPDIIHEPD
jgi:hypothetical protein